MNKETAMKIHKAAISAIEDLSSIILLIANEKDTRYSDDIHREVGIAIGEIEVKILSIVYKDFPELDDIS